MNRLGFANMDYVEPGYTPDAVHTFDELEITPLPDGEIDLETGDVIEGEGERKGWPWWVLLVLGFGIYSANK
jgi:hypothetical protein